MSGPAPGAVPGHPEPGLTGPGEPSRASAAPWVRATAPGGLPLVLGDDLGIAPAIRWDSWATLLPGSAAALLRLRGAAGPEPVDLDPATRHVWIDDDTGPVAVLRARQVEDDGPAGGTALLVEGLTVRPDVRHLGLGGALLSEVLARSGGRPLVADVPSEAVALFTRLQFAATATVLDTSGRVEALTRMRRMPEAPWREA
ncbi:GNAT family N-acetyltransferase [Kineosporia sp. A_224]|uniref:GNAT family N-acetyltransferase n=1 Tax=Kineosporia sp. A_224 TaxID=1962180 RepID=UPI000B4BD058|nr:GNAT family N-acetyltransferase [Kineosporia sp. A_224]